MKVIRFTGVFLLIVSVLFCIGVLIWSLFKADANTRSAVIGAIGVITVAMITHYKTRNREIAARHFADKRDGYMKFMDLLFDMIVMTKKNRKFDNEELLKRYIPIKKAIMIWGGPNLIEEWNFFETAPEQVQTSEQALFMFEKILRAIRLDLGHDDSSLPPGSLIAMILIAKDKDMVLGASSV